MLNANEEICNRTMEPLEFDREQNVLLTRWYLVFMRVIVSDFWLRICG